MVSGGTHPRKRTTVSVPKYRASFNDSIKDAAALFYSVNAGCLTPSSGFNVLRECLLLFANSTSDKTTIDAAFSAVGVKSPTVATLSNGVPLGSQKGSFFDTYYFKLDGVQAGEAVTCQTSADNGDADLFVRIGELPDPFEFSVLNDCLSGNAGSNEECTTDPLLEADTVYVAVAAAEDYEQLSVLCSRTGSIPKLSSGVALAGLQGNESSTAYYVLEDLRRGSGVTCATTGSIGDADLFVRIGSVPEPYVDGANDCQSVTAGVSNQTCTAVNRLLQSSPVYVAVHAATAFEGLTLKCTVRQGSGGGGDVGGGGGGNVGTGTANTTFVSLSNGRPLRDQNASPKQTKHYKLKKGVTAGEEVTCSLSGGTGDGDLFVRFGSRANPSKPQVNACYTTSSGLNDRCTTPPAKKSSDAFVAVSTVSGFANLTITCTRRWKCSVNRQSCQTNKDCCSSDLKCTGPTPSTRVCKKRPNANCGRRGGGLIVTRSCIGTSNGTGDGAAACVSRGGTCQRRRDCCGRGQGNKKLLTCDGGTKESRVCKACLSRGSTCKRNSQCCKGNQCLRGLCRVGK
jgi:Dickkopf N-terminal cysteine-rich region